MVQRRQQLSAEPCTVCILPLDGNLLMHNTCHTHYSNIYTYNAQTQLNYYQNTSYFTTTEQGCMPFCLFFKMTEYLRMQGRGSRICFIFLKKTAAYTLLPKEGSCSTHTTESVLFVSSCNSAWLH